MSIATELQNYADGLDDAYDAVNDMSGIIPQHKNMNNLDQAIRTIPQNTGITATTFHWGGSPNYSMYKDSGYTTAATYSDVATAYADGLVYIADGEDEVTYVVVSDIPDAHTITVTGIGLPGYEGGSTSYTYASSTWTKTATEFQKKLTAGANVQINGTTISATDTTYSDMVGATSLDAGTHGLVPAPAAGDEDKVLSGAGTWVAQTAAQVNSDWNAASGVSQILNKPSLATVATSGLYSDLTGTPTIPAAQVNSDWDAISGVAQILNKPSLAAVATSGAYSDLTGTPTIPAAQIQSDWTQTTTTALDYIKNKPTIPTVNNATLTIQKNSTTVKTFTANASSDVTCNISVPTQFSDLSGTVSTSQIASSAVTSAKIDWGNCRTFGTGTLNSTYFSSGTVQWTKLGNMVFVVGFDMALSTSPPNNSWTTYAISNLPKAASSIGNYKFNATRYGTNNLNLTLAIKAGATGLYFHYTAGTQTGTFNLLAVYAAA